MKSKKTLTCAIIVLLVICNVYLLYSIHKLKTESDNAIAILYPYAEKHTSLKANIVTNIKFVSRCIPDIEVSNRQNKTKRLSELFCNDSKPLFILRITDRYCNSCVKYFVDLFANERLNDALKFVYLTGFQNQNRVGLEAEELNIKNDMLYNVPFLDVPIDNLGYPYLMVLNKNLEIEYCYFPTRDHEQIDLENLKMIIDCYVKKYETL